MEELLRLMLLLNKVEDFEHLRNIIGFWDLVIFYLKSSIKISYFKIKTFYLVYKIYMLYELYLK
jgi:hypothetical protein